MQHFYTLSQFHKIDILSYHHDRYTRDYHDSFFFHSLSLHGGLSLIDKEIYLQEFSLYNYIPLYSRLLPVTSLRRDQ